MRDRFCWHGFLIPDSISCAGSFPAILLYHARNDAQIHRGAGRVSFTYTLGLIVAAWQCLHGGLGDLADAHRAG
jgi:hypothetical protein